MFVVDTNVLVYAANSNCPEHGRCRDLLLQWRVSKLPWYLTWSIVYEFIRITTHPRVLRQPWTAQAAWTFVEAVFASETLGILNHSGKHREIAQQTFEELPDLRGNLVHDSHTAIVMREHGIRRIYTRDADFHRFPFLEVVDPLRV
jgi:toxin-antitoxin system PIN domain toxin